MPDNLTQAQRSHCMARVRNKNTNLETEIRGRLFKAGYRFRKHVRLLPGSPDIVFATERLAVFVDGDFWHGYRFPTWSHTLPPFWREKIARNRARDRRNFARLRKMGWQVMRIWQHEIKRDAGRCTDRIVERLRRSS